MSRRGNPGRQIRAGKRPGLPDRHAGAGAPADDAAPARPRRRPQHRRLHLRLSRLAARRLRPGAVAGQALHQEATTSSSSPASTRTSPPPPCGAPSRSISIPAPLRRRVRHVVRQGPGRRPLGRRPQARQLRRHVQARRRAWRWPATTTWPSRRPRAHQSEPAFIAAGIPIIHAAGVQEYLDFGLHALRDVALLRPVGRLQGAERDGRIRRPRSTSIRTASRSTLPTDFILPPDGLHIRWPDDWLGQEARVITLQASGGAGLLARQQARPADAGPARCALRHRHRRQVLPRRAPGAGRARHRRRRGRAARHRDLQGRHGLAARDRGRDAPSPRASARSWWSRRSGRSSSSSSRTRCSTPPADRRPSSSARPTSAARRCCKIGRRAVARRDRARRIVGRASASTASASARKQRFDALQAPAPAGRCATTPAWPRVPYFCSGCPHNTSTKVPEGSMAMAGIGCHTLAIGMERNTKTFTHMGAEGATWVGATPLHRHAARLPEPGRRHLFPFRATWRSRHAVATNTNITYKILYNDAVAMTGGQPHDGNVHPWTISQQVHAEGVRRIALVSDEPDKYPIGTDWAPGVTFHHRDQLDEVQRELREYKGVSVLIYDQTCAAEKRRRRKRGTYPDPDQARVHQPGGLRGLRRLLGRVQLPVGDAGRDRVRPQARDRPVVLQQGLLLPQRLLPELRHRRRRQAAPGQGRASRRRTPAEPPLPRRARRCRRSATSPTAC